jgi:N-methylhydantoinase A
LPAGELGVRHVVIPPHPGNFSALGLLGADLVKSHARTRLLRLDAAGLAQASDTLHELFAGFGATSEAVQEAAVDLRYSGQEHTLTLPLAWDSTRVLTSPDDLAAAFTRAYDATFGHTMAEPVELVTLRATLRTVVPPPDARRQVSRTEGPTSVRRGDAYSFTAGTSLPFAIVDRAEVDVLAGPAIIVEPTSTTYLDAGFRARADASGALIIEREDA